jgi:hypothetical protein
MLAQDAINDAPVILVSLADRQPCSGSEIKGIGHEYLS